MLRWNSHRLLLQRDMFDTRDIETSEVVFLVKGVDG